MRIAALQFAPAWEDKAANYDQVRAWAARARDRGADWLVLPEMFATGFSLNPALTAEPEEGPTSAFLRELAASCGLGLIAGLVLEAPGGRGRNAALAIDAGGRLRGCYVKTHLIGLLGEDEHHLPGEGPAPFDLGDLRAACFICYDLRFPELFRMVAAECQVIFVIASWPEARQGHWDLLLPARAVEDQCYLVGVNRIGRGGGLAYAGGSAIYGPLGERLAHGGDREGLLLADLDAARVAEVRARMPFLGDRRFGLR